MRHYRSHLEAVESHKEPEDVIGALKNPEDPQIPHHPLHTRVLDTEWMGKECHEMSL